MIKHLHILNLELKRTIALSAAVLVTASSLFAFPDFKEAKSEADQGDALSQAIVATYYALGWQTAKDPALAARYAEQSANAGNPLGKFRLGALLRNGEGVPKDEAAGLRLQNEAAGIWSNGFDVNDPFQLTAVGVALFQGKVVSQDMVKAAQFYKKAADMGFAPAQYNYGMCLMAGHGIEKDVSNAQFYIKSSAQQQYGPALAFVKNNESIPPGNSSNESTAIETLENTQEDLFKIGQEKLINGYVDDSLMYFDKVIKNDDKNLNAYEWRGYANFINRNWELAMKDFNTFIDKSTLETSKWAIIWRWASQAKFEGSTNADNILKEIIQTKKVSDQWWNQMASALLEKKSLEIMIPETKKSDPKIEKARKLDVLFYIGLLPNIMSGNEEKNEQVFKEIANLGNPEYNEQWLTNSVYNIIQKKRNNILTEKISTSSYKDLESFLVVKDSLLQDKLILPDFEKKIIPLGWSDAALTKREEIDTKEYLEHIRILRNEEFVKVSKLKEIDYVYDNIISELEKINAPWKKDFLNEFSDLNNYVKINSKISDESFLAISCASGIVIAIKGNNENHYSKIYNGTMAVFIPKKVITNIEEVISTDEKPSEICFNYNENNKLISHKILSMRYKVSDYRGTFFVTPRFKARITDSLVRPIDEPTSNEFKALFNDFMILYNIDALGKAYQDSKSLSTAVPTKAKLMGINGLSWGSSAKETMRVVRGAIPLNLYEAPIVKTFASSAELLADRNKSVPLNLFTSGVSNEVYLPPLALLSFLEVSSGGLKLPFPLTIIFINLNPNSPNGTNGKSLPAYVFFFHNDELVASIRSEINKSSEKVADSGTNVDWDAIASKYGLPLKFSGVSSQNNSQSFLNAVIAQWPNETGIATVFSSSAFDNTKPGPSFTQIFSLADKSIYDISLVIIELPQSKISITEKTRLHDVVYWDTQKKQPLIQKYSEQESQTKTINEQKENQKIESITDEI